MTPASLEDFYSEMRTLASRIGAPEDGLPTCENGGYSLSISPSENGLEYILSNYDEGGRYEICRLTDSAKVMEAVFVNVTFSMAFLEVVNRYPPLSWWRHLLGNFGRPIALKQQRELQIVQERLLGEINSTWRDRTAVENALRLRREVDFFFGLE